MHWRWRSATPTTNPASRQPACPELVEGLSFSFYQARKKERPFDKLRVNGYGNKMIAKLTGRLDSSGAGHAVIDVGGVGYLVEASARTLDALGAVGSDVTIHTELLVGEDFLRLLGFARAEERDWFRLLVSVQGVGAKMALAILSALEIADLQRALASGDAAMVARSNGVGPKLAQRICNELKDKAGALGGIALGAPALSFNSLQMR